MYCRAPRLHLLYYFKQAIFRFVEASRRLLHSSTSLSLYASSEEIEMSVTNSRMPVIDVGKKSAINVKVCEIMTGTRRGGDLPKEFGVSDLVMPSFSQPDRSPTRLSATCLFCCCAVDQLSIFELWRALKLDSKVHAFFISCG